MGLLWPCMVVLATEVSLSEWPPRLSVDQLQLRGRWPVSWQQFGRPAGRHQLLGLFSWNAPGCCWYLLLNSWPIWDRNVSKITKWGCEEQHRQRSLQLASYHHHKAPFLCWGTSINDVRRFSVIFDLPTLPCSITSDFGPPYQYPKIGRHLWTFPWSFTKAGLKA